MKKFIYISIYALLLGSCTSTPKSVIQSNTTPQIFPDYTNIVIPNNIAPLNFKADSGQTILSVKVTTKNKTYNLSATDGQMIWNDRKWRKMLKNNINDTIFYTVTTINKAGIATEYKPFYQFISADSIDPYLAYRLINTGYVLWSKIGLYQRCVENFKQSPIIENRSVDRACMNCHTFCKQSPKTLLFHTRKYNPGTTIYNNGTLKKYSTKTSISMSEGVYASWNPNGKIVALSTNFISQRFNNNYSKRIYVSDSKSDIVLLNLDTETLTTCPALSTIDFENLPAWAPDGKTLYYITAPPRTNPTDTFDFTFRYSLTSITYNADNNTWGEVDTLLRATDVNGSITFPKPSPCGNYIAFTLADYGYFTPFNNEADIYLLNLKTKEVTAQDNVNSNFAESNHNWSNNGKWFVVGSKAPDGLITKPYFAHFENGKFSKRFVLPQQSPDFYHQSTENFNNADFITGKVEPSPNALRNAVVGNAVKVKADPTVDIDALSGATANKKE